VVHLIAEINNELASLQRQMDKLKSVLWKKRNLINENGWMTHEPSNNNQTMIDPNIPRVE
jgi:hypothetical protein